MKYHWRSLFGNLAALGLWVCAFSNSAVSLHGAEPLELTYVDLKLDLPKIVKKLVRLKGGFHYLDEGESSFVLRLDNNPVIVDMTKLPQESQEAVRAIRDFSETPVTVTGTVTRGGVQRDQPTVVAERIDIEDTSTRNSYRSRRGVVTVPELRVNPPRYLETSVSMQGRFDFVQPGRESFRFWRGVDEVEVDFSHLSPETQRQILSLKNFSDQSLKVSGILKGPPSGEVAFGLDATSIQIDPIPDAASAAAPQGEADDGLSYANILLNPDRYLNNEQTIKGGFELCDPHRKLMQIWQGGDSMEVYYRDLPQDQINLIESQHPFSSIVIVVSGMIHPYPRAPHRFMIEAHSVALDKGD